MGSCVVEKKQEGRIGGRTVGQERTKDSIGEEEEWDRRIRGAAWERREVSETREDEGQHRRGGGMGQKSKKSSMEEIK